MHGHQLEFDVDEVICRQGDPSSDLFFLQSGRLLVCIVQGTQVKALARIEPGEFIGELSFFDGKPRSGHVVALEKSKVIQIPREELSSALPLWFLESGKNLTKKIRLLDEVLHETNIRKASLQEQKQLSIEEQRRLLGVLTQ